MHSKEDVDEFFKNCEEGNLDEVNKALSKYPAIIHAKGNYGKSI